MAWKKNVWCFVVTFLLTSFGLCDGRTDEEEGRPAVRGAHHMSRVESGSTRPGSLVFKNDRQNDSYLNDECASDASVNFVLVFPVSLQGLAAKLKRSAPSVQCGDNLMTLTVKRSEASHFLVDSGEEPRTPLSQMPSTCGFSVKRSRRDVQYAASYQGCHVKKEDDDYVLPLLFRGSPITMSCPNTLTSPTVVCFPSKMVVKLGGVAAKDLKIKVSGAWQHLSSACSSCGLTFKEIPGEVALIVPYSKDLCVEIKDGEYSLSLQWADYELLTTCPSVRKINPTARTTTPSSDGNQALQHPQYPYLQMFSSILKPQSTQIPAPVAPVPQYFNVAPNSPENKEVPEAQSPPLTFMPQFFLFPGAEAPTQPPGNENAFVKQVQLPRSLQQSPQYQVPFFPEFPMLPGIFQPTNPSPLYATNTETLATTGKPSMGNEQKPEYSLQPQFPMLPQHPFPMFFNHPLSPEDKTLAVDDPKTVTEQLKPQHLHPQIFQFPMFYPSLNYPPQGANALLQTPAPAATSTRAAMTKTTPPGNSFYQPHPYIPVYLVPEQAPVPAFLHPPGNPAINPAPTDQREHKPVYHAMQPFYPFLPDQRQMVLTGSSG